MIVLVGYGMQSGFGGGPMRGPGFSQRGTGPYGAGYYYYVIFWFIIKNKI